ncbi:uncharacterized protein BXZ73DRAFT_86026, partial [Epithele typhae]|uniref:uncharacterized protein n=1 Tax=Epithele typhae TaxID=378194 RepID=UPI0020085E9F
MSVPLKPADQGGYSMHKAYHEFQPLYKYCTEKSLEYVFDKFMGGSKLTESAEKILPKFSYIKDSPWSVYEWWFQLQIAQISAHVMELAATESEGTGSLRTLDTSSKEALRDREDIHVHQGIRPDLSVYFKETLEDLAEIRGATESKAPAKHKEDSAKGKAKQRRTPKEERLRQERSRYAGKASFAHIVVPIEAKTKRTLSAFSFPTSKVDAENPDSAEPPI